MLTSYFKFFKTLLLHTFTKKYIWVDTKFRNVGRLLDHDLSVSLDLVIYLLVVCLSNKLFSWFFSILAVSQSYFYTHFMWPQIFFITPDKMMDTAHGSKPWNTVITCRSAASASHLSPLISSSSIVIPLTHVHLFARISHRSPETLSACKYMWFVFLYFTVTLTRYCGETICSNASTHTNTAPYSHTSLLTIKNPWPQGTFTAAHPNASSLRPFISRNVHLGA